MKDLSSENGLSMLDDHTAQEQQYQSHAHEPLDDTSGQGATQEKSITGFTVSKIDTTAAQEGSDNAATVLSPLGAPGSKIGKNSDSDPHLASALAHTYFAEHKPANRDQFK